MNFEFIVVQLFFQDVVLMHVMGYAKWHENARYYEFGSYLYTCKYTNNICIHVIHYAKWHKDGNMKHVMLNLETT